MEDEEVVDENEFILSLCWDSGKLAASYYNLLTLELIVKYKNFLQQTLSLNFLLCVDHERVH